ncbi:unnamed protein product [Rotaria sp. Silwood1]|nr:unnamed protein product [Rotaria sp. Silwood1]
MRVMKEEQLPLEHQDNKNEHKSQENQFHRRLAEDKVNSIRTSVNAYQVSLIDLTSENTKKTTRRLTTTVILPEIKHSAIDDKNSKLNVKTRSDSMDKCPLCFMIFPQRMKHADREQHVNEHYT